MNKNARLNKVSPWLALMVSFCLSTAGAFTESGNTTTTTGGTAGQTTGGSGAQTSYVMPSGGGNASSSGSNTSKKQDMGAMMNIAAGAMYGGICATCETGAGCWACPLIPLAMMAASGMGGASGKSGAAGMDMAGFDPSAGGSGAGMDGGSEIDPLTGRPVASGTGGRLPAGSTAITKGLQDLKNQLTRAGVTISPDGKTMTTPNGRKFDMSNGGGNGSKEDLMAMGMTAAEADAALAASGKFAKDYASKFAQMKQLDGAGGGGGRSTASDVAGGAGGSADMYGWDRDARNRNARNKNKISGLTKKFGDDTIGVSGDNIFEMVTRRYKARDEKNDFLKD